MFPCQRDKILALLAALIAALCTASIIYIYRIPLVGPDYHPEYLGMNMETWILIRNMGYIIAFIIIFYLYHRYMVDKMKKLESKFSNYLKDLDELNEEWADENHELWNFIENVLEEKDLNKIRRKARKLLKSRERNKKSI